MLSCSNCAHPIDSVKASALKSTGGKVPSLTQLSRRLALPQQVKHVIIMRGQSNPRHMELIAKLKHMIDLAIEAPPVIGSFKS